MGSVVPFSKANEFFSEYNGNIEGCLVDTQLLVAFLYEPHAFYEDAGYLFEQIAAEDISIFTTVTTRSEFIDINRRIIMTELLIDMLAPSSKWRLTTKAKSKMQTQKQWIDSQARLEKMPVLRDNQFKDLKKTFSAKTRSGKDGWLTICEHALQGKLESTWGGIEKSLGINHLEIRKGDENPHLEAKVKWSNMYDLCEKTCLSGSDAMILNMLQSSVFPFIASADFDMAYAIVTNDDISKTVFVPDRMYKEIKGIR